MEPTYPPGTHLYGAPISTPLERGDVVVLDDSNEEYAVKRIIGLPGETVQLWRGCVFINRQMLVEPYLPKHTYTWPMERERRGATFVLGDKEYFVLGDNRPRSADSRVYGPVRRKQIKQTRASAGGFRLRVLRPVHAASPRNDSHPPRVDPHRRRQRPGSRRNVARGRPDSLRFAAARWRPGSHLIGVASGGAFVAAGGGVGSGGSPSLARNNARTSGGSPCWGSSMRLRTS